MFHYEVVDEDGVRKVVMVEVPDDEESATDPLADLTMEELRERANG